MIITPTAIKHYLKEDEQRALPTRWQVDDDSVWVIFYTLVTGRETARIRLIETMFLTPDLIVRLVQAQPKASIEGIQYLIGCPAKDINAFLNYLLEN